MLSKLKTFKILLRDLPLGIYTYIYMIYAQNTFRTGVFEYILPRGAAPQFISFHRLRYPSPDSNKANRKFYFRNLIQPWYFAPNVYKYEILSNLPQESQFRGPQWIDQEFHRKQCLCCRIPSRYESAKDSYRT